MDSTLIQTKHVLVVALITVFLVNQKKDVPSVWKDILLTRKELAYPVCQIVEDVLAKPMVCA